MTKPETGRINNMKFAPGRRNRLGLIPDLGLTELEARLVRTGSVEVVRLGQGEPIVLVPGLAGGWRLLVPLARRLARRHEVVMVGLRGDRGPLDMSGRIDARDHASEIARVMDSLRLERPWVLGVSFGGAVALELAIERGGQLGGLVVSGTAARYGGLIATLARGVLERYPLPSDNRFVNQFFNLLHGGRPASERLARFVVERCWETDQGVMLDRLRVLDSFDATNRLWQIQTPTLVVSGPRDVFVNPDDQRALASSIGLARYAEIEGAGHIGFLTHRAEVANQVMRFVRARGAVRH